MNVEEIRTVGVVGAGSMGTGIIQVAAQSGFEVKAVDVDDAACARAASVLAKILERLVAKEKITEEQKKQVLGRISFSADVATLRGVPFLFEAVFESVEVKKAIFSKLDAICGDEVIYATNTSSLSITEMASMDRAASEAFSKLLQDANNLLPRMKKVVVAAINGHALGGGCELAMACDYRLMKKGKALIGLPEATLGILPGAGGTQRLPRLVGLSKAMDILLRGKAMGPEEALAIGLVDRLIEPEVFMDEVMKFAEQLASGAGKAMGFLKAAVYDGIDLPMEQALAVERRYGLENLGTHDAKEGLAAFAEKRKPNFLSR